MLSALAVALSASALVLILDAKNKELETAKLNQSNFEAIAAKTKAATDAEAAAVTQAQAVSDTIAFMLAASKTGAERAALINQVRQYVYENAVVTGIDLSDGKTVKINAQVTTPDQYARFLVNLRRASDTNGGPLFAGLPKAGGVKGFPEGINTYILPAIPTDQPVVIPYPLNIAAAGNLKYPVVLPPDPVGAAPAAAAPGAPGGA